MKEGCDITALTYESGIYGLIGSRLTIDSSTVRATGGTSGSMRLNSLTLRKCAILQPDSAIFDDTKFEKGIYLDGKLVTTEVVIGPTYQLHVKGKQVNAANAPDVLGDGKIEFKPSTCTLTLHDATINAEEKPAIQNDSIKKLTIHLKGNSQISSTDAVAAIICNANTTITGDGTLNVNAPKGSGISLGQRAILTIDNVKELTVSGEVRGIGAHDYGRYAELLIRNSHVKAEGKEDCSIGYISQFTLEDCTILTPEGAEHYRGAVVDSRYNAIKTEIELIPAFELYVKKQKVHILNYTDIRGDGTVRYDPDTKTLTLENATLEDEYASIAHKISGLTIELIGNNTLTSTRIGDYTAIGISSASKTTITGSGTLIARGHGCGIATYSDLTIRGGCTVIAESYGDGTGLHSYSDTNWLTIDSSTLKTKGAGQGSLFNFRDLVLKNCSLVQPKEASYIWYKNPRGLYLDENLGMGEVLIGFHVTGISLEQADYPLDLGDSLTLSAHITPSNAACQAVKWSSSNTTVATVDSAGMVKGLAKGESIITVTTVDGNFTATCRITVNEVPVTSVTLSETSKTLKPGDRLTLTVTIQPANATIHSVEWKSSNTSVATVDSGRVSTYQAGTAEIAVTVNGEKSATCKVTVSEDDTPVVSPESHLTLSPNPATSQITIHGLQAPTPISIITLQGNTLHTHLAHPNQPIDISALPTGLYLLRLKHTTLPLVKQ